MRELIHIVSLDHIGKKTSIYSYLSSVCKHVSKFNSHRLSKLFAKVRLEHFSKRTIIKEESIPVGYVLTAL